MTRTERPEKTAQCPDETRVIRAAIATEYALRERRSPTNCYTKEEELHIFGENGVGGCAYCKGVIERNIESMRRDEIN